ncbi:DUF3891 family protein [Halosimplex salinum]|uniref:DUF3891 family protein n=1 Tax=Halosimplex salinum TaxID=1710538 RepID=UPI0013DE6663|nr:DUF3891 family protein [Halosimplex salinum]
MIVAETTDGYRFVTQPDHADLAGRFAEHWGNDRFDRPEPFESLVVAAYAHDTGWRAYDRRPHLDDEGDPVDFRDMPAATWIGLYEEGIDAVVEMDDYAGLLVSMHGAGLRKQRYGLSPGWPETPAAFREFVDREERRQERLLDRLLDAGGAETVTDADRDLLASLHGAGGVPNGYDGRIWADYRRLQAWDALSLSFCITDSPPGYDAIDAVPTSGPRDGTEVSISRVADGEFRLDPYPFDQSPVEVPVQTRTVARDAVTDEASLARAYYANGVETRTLSLGPVDR